MYQVLDIGVDTDVELQFKEAVKHGKSAAISCENVGAVIDRMFGGK